MSKAGTMKATSLRKFLAFLMVLSILGASAGFYYGLTQIRDLAADTNQRLIDADASGQQIEQLRQLKITLEESDNLVSKAQDVYATQDNYQTQAIRDLQKYASTARISIEDIEFPASAEGEGVVNSRPIEVRLETPVPYERFIRFIELIEGNIPIMQLDTIQVARPTTPEGSQVSVGTILIRMAVR